MEIVLVGSGKFQAGDIRFKWTLIHYYSTHEYLRIALDDGQLIDIDLWGQVFGIAFGDHAHGFKSGSLLTHS